MSKIVTILIADDHAVVRRGLKTLLEQHSSFKVVAEAETGNEAVEMAQATHPDVAVLDIRMPGMSGIEACRQIVNSVEDCKVIMLTAYMEEDLLFAAIKAGAVGYVLKMVGRNELVHAVERASNGEGFLDSGMTATVFQEVYKAGKSKHSTAFSVLTSREVAVLTLVTRGMTNRQIATKLYLSEGTTRNYVSSMLAKLAVANRAEAAAFAVKHGIDELVVTSRN